MNQHLIYGDIGGTKTLLQMAEFEHGAVHELDMQRYRNSEYASFSDILCDFLDTVKTKHPCQAAAACFAVAGPIADQRVNLTNLSWQIDAAEIAHAFSIPRVMLLNDFEAAALAVDLLSPADWVTLQEGYAQAQTMRVILGAGTGMGVAWLVWQKDHYQPIPTEAGHIDFAPVNALQLRLLEALQKKFHHVSVEKLLSGAGLTQIFNFLQSNTVESHKIASLPLDEDNGAAITTLAIEHKHPNAIKALEIFTEIYGAFAGNLALTGLCRNGVYIAGGIAPKILKYLQTGNFMRAFCDKGRFSGLLREIPVKVITHPAVSLLGAKRKVQDLSHLQG